MRKFKKQIDRMISFVLVLLILSGLSAHAATPSGYAMTNMERGKGYTFFSGGTVTKGTSSGTSARFTVDYNENGASMYYCVLKMDGVPASFYYNTSRTGTFYLAYDTENNGSGDSFGMYGKPYQFRVAHRSQSSQTLATVNGVCTP